MGGTMLKRLNLIWWPKEPGPKLPLPDGHCLH